MSGKSNHDIGCAKIRWLLISIFTAGLFACSDRSEKPKASETAIQRHIQISQRGILADFVQAVSSDDVTPAFELLHPKLREAWTAQRFEADWTAIKKSVGSAWRPQAMETFSGSSPQGFYEKATYHLDSDFRSIDSVELTGLQQGDSQQIVQIYVRIAQTDPPSQAIRDWVGRFMDDLLAEKYDAASTAIAEGHRKQYPPQVLRMVGSIFRDSSKPPPRLYYRLCANSVWYQAVRISATNDPAVFLEIILSTQPDKLQIGALTFKARGAPP